ncbi:hypothetical protein CPG37_02700 [Malaciobacter canalis]|uniref:Uncharacterized protein n=1 Tax=Malaciobacter canalis TaxID=1912871 RepID=A0ABX4LS32_9BACT|nr:hypothetical protein [Malaciobacter canalis]PHO10770.1 hypothetical protein CPG37_02700 [Malaciobacter canalis]QEE33927.1 hypothetical protein ACAN_2489 [Malaciobacter canalis]
MRKSKIRINPSLKYKIKRRANKVGIDLQNLYKVANLDKKDVIRLLNLDFTSKDSIEKTTQILGLNSYGKEIKSVKQLRKDRARFKAIRVVSMVQDTSSLEEQGLESMAIKRMIVRTGKEFLKGSYSSRLWK